MIFNPGNYPAGWTNQGEQVTCAPLIPQANNSTNQNMVSPESWRDALNPSSHFMMYSPHQMACQNREQRLPLELAENWSQEIVTRQQ